MIYQGSQTELRKKDREHEDATRVWHIVDRSATSGAAGSDCMSRGSQGMSIGDCQVSGAAHGHPASQHLARPGHLGDWSASNNVVFVKFFATSSNEHEFHE